jgi:hypothetical protein
MKKKKDQISEISNVVVFFWFDKRFPGAGSSIFGTNLDLAER